MILGYNTNGLAHHDLFSAIELLAEIGYGSVALTIDHHALSPFHPNLSGQLARLRRTLEQLGLRSVIETGARFLLDPRNKHEPTLLSTGARRRIRRIEFYKHAIRSAAELESDCVSLWSGALPGGVSGDEAMARLVEGLDEVLQYASVHGVAVGFEPEPGMFIDTLAGYADLCRRLPRFHLGLTLDVGHLHCRGEVPLAEHVRRWAARAVNVHIEDMRAGMHEHLMFGDGEIDFPPVLRALVEGGYGGGVHVELSRHSHEAPMAARRAYDFLQMILTGVS